MSIIQIRNVDEQTELALKAEAKGKRISMSELIRNILDSHILKSEFEDVDLKYKTFVTELLNLYQLDREEVKRLHEQNLNLLMELREVLRELEERFE